METPHSMDEHERYDNGNLSRDLELPPELLHWLSHAALDGQLLLWEDEDE